MSTLNIEGGFSLGGNVKPSGSKDSAVKLIISALLSNEDIVLEKIPRTGTVLSIIEIAQSIGASVTWIGDNKLQVNGSFINTSEIPMELGSKTRFSTLFAGPLLFRFGEAILPKTIQSKVRAVPINRWLATWEALGVDVKIEDDVYVLKAGELSGKNINFNISTHTGTANAIISSVFVNGKTTITNAAEETEVDDLIKFINTIGGNVERVEPRKIVIEGNKVFKGGYYENQIDNIEVAAYGIAALITKGNITITGIADLQLTSFVNFLTKIGARYEIEKNSLNVWYGGETYNATKVESSPAPGFLTDWLPFATLMLNFTEGNSIVHDTIYVDRFSYTQDLNRMGADIEVKRPSEVGVQCVISDESYDFNSLGEPYTVAKISGPRKLRGTRLNMGDERYDSTLIIAALSAEGRSELIGIDEMSTRYENFFDKLSNLGAHIE